jgi:hypothetical protein
MAQLQYQNSVAKISIKPTPSALIIKNYQRDPKKTKNVIHKT